MLHSVTRMFYHACAAFEIPALALGSLYQEKPGRKGISFRGTNKSEFTWIFLLLVATEMWLMLLTASCQLTVPGLSRLCQG